MKLRSLLLITLFLALYGCSDSIVDWVVGPEESYLSGVNE